MEAQKDGPMRLKRLRKVWLLAGVLFLLCFCFAIWHFASAPRPEVSRYHDTDISPQKCLSCHQRGNDLCPQLPHRALSFCFPCHLPRKKAN